MFTKDFLKDRCTTSEHIHGRQSMDKYEPFELKVSIQQGTMNAHIQRVGVPDGGNSLREVAWAMPCKIPR